MMRHALVKFVNEFDKNACIFLKAERSVPLQPNQSDTICIIDRGNSLGGINHDGVHTIDLSLINDCTDLEEFERVTNALENYFVFGEIMRSENFYLTIHSVKKKRTKHPRTGLHTTINFLYRTSFGPNND